jgi:hypothetical protein
MVDHVDRRTSRRHGARRTIAALTLSIALTAAFAATALAGPATVQLRTAGGFAVLGGSGMTNTGASTIFGDVGSSPTHSETGFALCPATDCVTLTGTNHDAADPNDAVTQQAKTDLTTAYNDAFGRTGGTAVSAPLGGGATLVAGVYTAAVNLAVAGDLTLDGGGNADSVFIFQAKTGTLITAAGTSAGIPNTRVLLTNGAQACNVFWQVGSSATIETATQFVGTIMADQSVTLNTGATIDGGRALARNGAVTLQANTIRATPCAAPSGGVPTTSAAPGSATSPAVDGVDTATAPARPTGSARVTGPRRPTGPFTVAVTGHGIAKVVFHVDGRPVATVRAKRGRTRFTTRINPLRQTRRVHRVTVTVTYTPQSHTPPTTLRLVYQRPPLAQRPPDFTG